MAVAIATALMLIALSAGALNSSGAPSRRQLGSTIDWNGWIAGVSDGTYAFSFAVPSGGGARLAIDGRVVADGSTSTPIHLDYSPRPFDFEYRRDSRPEAPGPTTDSSLHPTPDGPHISWSRDGSAAVPVPVSVLFAHRPRPFAVAVSSGLRAFVATAEWLWVLTLVGATLAVADTAWRVRRDSLAIDTDWRVLRWIVLGSIALNAVPVWWGLPATWPPDELTPSTVLRGFAAHFSNGWFDRWPPLHYYVLTIAMSPVMLLNWFGRINYEAAGWSEILTLIERFVSLAAAAGTLICAALVASRVFGRRAGWCAAAIFALAVPFPYYAKTANLDVPYLFWFSVSLVFYFRLLETMRTREAVAFAVFATLAVCTKDQAYALYPLMGVAIVVGAWRARRVVPMLAGVAAAVIVFALSHNLAFNWTGFVEHVRYIAGPGSENYRVFAPTLAGRLGLLSLTATLIKYSWGWPITIICAAGVVHAVFVRRCLPALALLAPVISYYVAFVNVILYNYDRFVMPMTLILSMFGGYAIDRFLSSTRLTAPWRRGLVAAAFAYTLLYAATIDVLMLRDSRGVVERWAAARVRPGEEIAISGPRELEPAFTVAWIDAGTLEELERSKPAYYVLSADYAGAVPRETGWGQLIDALQAGKAGYGLAARVRCRSPWPWLPDAHPELVGPRPIAPGGMAISVLRDINPTLEVYVRGGPAHVDVGCARSVLP